MNEYLGQSNTFNYFEHAFGVGEHDFCTFSPGELGLGDDVGLGFDPFGDIVKTVKKTVKKAGKAAGKAAGSVAKVANSAANEAKKAVVSAAKVVAKSGGDAGKFIAKQSEAFAKDPIGQLSKVAASGGLGLIGVHPEHLLAAAGIPSPDAMIKKLGLPTPTEIGRKVYSSALNPGELLAEVPGLNEVARYIPSAPDPAKMAAGLVSAAARGDLDELKRQTLDIGHQAANVIAMVPGAGNVVGGPLNAAITLIETGSALKAALQLLLSQVPGIPPQIRDILAHALNGIADIVERGKTVTDVVIAQFKQGVHDEAEKAGASGPVADIVDDLVDGAIQVIFRHRPIDRTALDFAEKGIATAAGKTIASDPKLQAANRALTSLKDAYQAINKTQTLTTGIKQLSKQDPQKKDPVIQKRIKDIRASIAAQNLIAQGHVKQADSTLGKMRIKPHLRTSAAMQARAKPHLRTSAAMKVRLTSAKATTPTPKAPQLPSAAVTRAYGPYPSGMHAGVSGPGGRHGGGGHGGGHGGGGGHRGGGGGGRHFGGARHHFGRPIMHPFARGGGGGRWPGWWWDQPYRHEVVTQTETCQTWGDPVEMPPAMQTAAKIALNVSKGRPTTVRGPDGVLYLFSVENGAQTARPCAAVATS